MTTTLSLFACKNVSFEEPFNGGQEIKIFISKSHATEGSTRARGNGAAIWVESVNNKAFTVCVLEYGDGSSGTSQVNWMALQSVPPGAQVGTASLNSWTSGTNCKRIAFEKVRFVLFFILFNFISLTSYEKKKPSAFCFTLVISCTYSFRKPWTTIFNCRESWTKWLIYRDPGTKMIPWFVK